MEITTHRADDTVHKALLEITGPIIDQAKTLAYLDGDTSLAKELLDLMQKSLTEELPLLQQAYQRQDWEAIEAIAHKLRGGTGYCGLVRLEQACCHLEKYLRSGARTWANALYQQLLSEILLLKKHLQKDPTG